MTIIKMSEMNESIIRTIDPTIELADNAMLKHRPDLFDQWDFEKNDLIGLDVYKVTRGSDKKVWWQCTKCPSSYDTSISNKMQNRGCPYCRGVKINETNSLFSNASEVMKQWHPTKNVELNPHALSFKSMRKAWWLGECGHEWDAVIRSRTSLNTGCPFCVHNPQTLKGYNDLWTTHPHISQLLADSDDGYKYTSGTTKKVDWNCPECNSLIKDRSIGYIVDCGRLPCVNCSDGFSYSEKFIYHLLKENNINFEAEKVFDWAGKIRYDFYLPEFNWIIESHGIQHYQEIKFHKSNNRGLKYQKQQDEKKESLAKKNNISQYTVLDCRESNGEYIISAVLSSDLKNLITIIDMNLLKRKSLNSLIVDVSQMWSLGESFEEIKKKLKVHETTLRVYLRKAAKLGLCNYSTKETLKRSGYKKQGKRVIQLTKDLKIVKEWTSLREIQREVGYSGDYISKVCRGLIPTSKGYIWRFAEDYYKEENNIDND